jgi:hypothetical protein
VFFLKFLQYCNERRIVNFITEEIRRTEILPLDGERGGLALTHRTLKIAARLIYGRKVFASAQDPGIKPEISGNAATTAKMPPHSRRAIQLFA